MARSQHKASHGQEPAAYGRHEMIDIHAIAPVGLRDDILHQRASRSRPLRALTEVIAVAQTPWVDNAPTGSWQARRRLVGLNSAICVRVADDPTSGPDKRCARQGGCVANDGLQAIN